MSSPKFIQITGTNDNKWINLNYVKKIQSSDPSDHPGKSVCYDITIANTETVSISNNAYSSYYKLSDQIISICDPNLITELMKVINN